MCRDIATYHNTYHRAISCRRNSECNPVCASFAIRYLKVMDNIEVDYLSQGATRAYKTSEYFKDEFIKTVLSYRRCRAVFVIR